MLVYKMDTKKLYEKLLICICCVNIIFSLNGKIHVFGDSHTFIFKSLAETRYFEGRTMYRVGRDKLAGLSFSQLGVKENDTVVLCFGEIDVRCHIIKQAKIKKCSVEEIISNLSEAFFDTILINKKFYKKINVVVYNVVPPTDMNFNPYFPIVGTLKERVYVERYLNCQLKMLCKKHNCFFLETNHYFENPDGSLNPNLSDGIVHLSGSFPARTIWYELNKLISDLN